MENFKIIMLAVDCNETNIVYHYLKGHFKIEKVIIEQKISRTTLIKNRIKKLGLTKVIGQLFFQFFTQRILFSNSSRRRNEIIDGSHLDTTPIPESDRVQVESVNNDATIDLIRKLQPSLIVVNGTRIISKKVLACTSAKFINMHMGITPKYRGVHGAYWALVNKDPGLCGVTVHYIDAGIDTGSVLKQAMIQPDAAKDNFTTYPYLQLAAGLPYMHESIDEISHATSSVNMPLSSESALWYHPTFYQYWKNRLLHGVK
ncbi:MAG: hypothetical protein IT257_05485 [Chitinophagaceae bacterium]|nr:hypothetical protein [Chitinophagaceae bacterium]